MLLVFEILSGDGDWLLLFWLSVLGPGRSGNFSLKPLNSGCVFFGASLDLG